MGKSNTKAAKAKKAIAAKIATLYQHCDEINTHLDKLELEIRWDTEAEQLSFSHTILEQQDAEKIRKRFPRLLSQEEIDDSSIFYFLEQLQQACSVKGKKIAFIDSQSFDNGIPRKIFLQRLQNSQKNSWDTTRITLKAAEMIYFPICKSLSKTDSEQSKHWFLVIAKKTDENCYTLAGLDGLNEFSVQNTLFNQVKMILKTLYHDTTIQFNRSTHYSLPSQVGDKDCGAVICFGAMLSALGEPGEKILSVLGKLKSYSCDYSPLREYCAQKLLALSSISQDSHALAIPEEDEDDIVIIDSSKDPIFSEEDEDDIVIIDSSEEDDDNVMLTEIPCLQFSSPKSNSTQKIIQIESVHQHNTDIIILDDETDEANSSKPNKTTVR